MREALTLRAADFGITLEDVAITHLSFGTEFTKAVEMKQVSVITVGYVMQTKWVTELIHY